MNRRRATLTVAASILVVLVAVIVIVPVPYVVMSPGVTVNTIGDVHGTPVISITGHKTYPTGGDLDLTTVSITSPGTHLRLPAILQAWTSSNNAVLPRDVIYPPSQTVTQVEQEDTDEMLDAQSSAVAAGLQEAGIAVKTNVTVQDVISGAPADGVLKSGDVIKTIDGTRVKGVEDAVSDIEAIAPGTKVTLGIARHGKPTRVTLTTEPNPSNTQQSRVGVSLTTVLVPPFPVNIDLGQKIGGPSAGLMLALGVYDKLTPGELTGGRDIAGTGTIDPDGKVGEIGGIQQKIAGAHRSGATIFFVPAANCAEAARSPYASQVALIKVSTMDDAIKALKAYAAGTQSSLTRCS